MRKTLKSVAAISILSAGVLSAEESKPMDGSKFKFGPQYNISIFSDSDGLNSKKNGPDEPNPELNYPINFLHLVGQAMPHEDITFDLDLDTVTVNAVGDFISIASVKYQAHPMFSISLGRMLLPQGGWDNKNIGVATITKGNMMSEKLPLKTTADSLAFQVGFMGTFSLFFTPDALHDAGAGDTLENDKNNSIAMLFEYAGDFGMLKPLVQVGMYDNMKSMEMALGAVVAIADLEVTAEYLSDSRNNAKRDAGDSTKVTTRTKDTSTGINAVVAYKLGSATISGDYSTWSNSLGSDKDKKNPDPKLNEKANEFDKNASTMGLSLVCHNWGEGFNPYVSFSNVGGNFTNAADNKSLSLSKNVIKVGVFGTL